MRRLILTIQAVLHRRTSSPREARHTSVCEFRNASSYYIDPIDPVVTIGIVYILQTGKNPTHIPVVTTG